jgi:hypothetical protein
VLKLLAGWSAITALHDAQATQRLLAPKFDLLMGGSRAAEQMRHAIGISAHLTASTRMLSEFRRPFTFELPTSLSVHAYRLVIETTPASPTEVEADRVAFAGHDALGIAEMSLALADEAEDADQEVEDDAYGLMPDRLHVQIRVALANLHPHLVARLDGAWERLSTTGPDAASQAAHSVQELIDGTLRAAAPDADVLAWHTATGLSADELHTNGPTRSLRVKYAIRNRPDQTKAARYYLRGLSDVVSVLQEAKHGAEGGSDRFSGSCLLSNVIAMATTKIEDGIRSYLDSLGTSNRPVVDREAVKALRGQIKDSSDPIEKLRLLAALEEEQAGRVPDSEGDKAVFVAEAKGWAESENIPVSAFQALKVPDDVLREAGFTVTASATRSTGSRSLGGPRAPRIPFEDVEAAAKKLGSGWKLADLAAALDREPATVRNYVNKLVEEGLVSVIGDDAEHDGRGRAAKIYGAP